MAICALVGLQLNKNIIRQTGIPFT